MHAHLYVVSAPLELLDSINFPAFFVGTFAFVLLVEVPELEEVPESLVISANTSADG